MQKQSWISPSQVAELIRIARAHGLSELAVQQGSARVQIKLSAEGAVPSPLSPGHHAPPGPGADPTTRMEQLLSPMTGVFYVAPTPNDPPFVQAGDVVHEGDPIGLIEAMKVFSEVLADRSGRVKRVLVSNGQLVQQGEALVDVTPIESAPVDTAGEGLRTGASDLGDFPSGDLPESPVV